MHFFIVRYSKNQEVYIIIFTIMKFDLHFHTTLSDGGKTPEQTVAIAKELGLQFMACTDHDVVNTRIPELARAVGIDAVE